MSQKSIIRYKLFSPLVLLSIIALSMISWPAQADSSNKRADRLSLHERDTLLFAKAFVENVRGNATIDTYVQYMHPNVKSSWKNGSTFVVSLYKNALKENTLINKLRVLDENVNVQWTETDATIIYTLPRPIRYNSVYSNSYRFGFNLVFKKGRITLKKYRNRWIVDTHFLVSEQRI